jgi:hypothetical protein
VIDFYFVIVNSLLVVSLSEVVVVALIRIEDIDGRTRIRLNKVREMGLIKFEGMVAFGNAVPVKGLQTGPSAAPLALPSPSQSRFAKPVKLPFLDPTSVQSMKPGMASDFVAQDNQKRKGSILDYWSTDGAAELVNLLNSLGERSKVSDASGNRVGAIALQFRVVRV